MNETAVEVTGYARISDEQIDHRREELKAQLEEAINKLDAAQAEVNAIRGAIQEASVWSNTIRKAREEERDGEH